MPDSVKGSAWRFGTAPEALSELATATWSGTPLKSHCLPKNFSSAKPDRQTVDPPGLSSSKWCERHMEKVRAYLSIPQRAMTLGV